jgi:DNA polymerase-1
MKCETCPFKREDDKKVYGEGSRILKQYKITLPSTSPKIKLYRDVIEYDNLGEYPVVCVGMAPAREEMEQERPFVGVSGQILRQTLKQLGVEEYYVCNIFLCPITDDSLVPQAQECCRNVIDEVLARKPKLVIALGDLPLHTLADTPYSIKECEGRVITSKVGPLLPLTHPAYYWRRPQDFYDFPECMRSGVSFLKGTYQQCVDPTMEIVTSGNLSDVLNKLDKYEEIGVDTETVGLYAYGWEPGHILEMGLAGTNDHAYIVPQPLIKEFKSLLESKKGIFWNAAFDASFLKQEGINPYIYFDGMVAHFSIDERPYGHGLKKVARIYIGADDWESDILRYLPARKKSKEEVDYSVIPTEKRYEYLSKDVTRTLQLKGVLEPEVNPDLLYKMLMPAVRMFVEIQERGMKVDPVKIMSMSEGLEADLIELDKKIYELTGEWLNSNSPKQVKEYVYGKLELPVDPYFGETTGKEALAPHREEYEQIGAILDYRELSKLKNTYLDGFAKFVDHNYRIHPAIKVAAAETGRLASEHPSIMNIKNLKRLKEVFIADRYFGHFDIKGNELRWYGLTAEDKEMLRILNTVPYPGPGKCPQCGLEPCYCNDPHHQVGLVAFDGDGKKAKEFRTGVKAGVFGTMYRRGLTSMYKQFGPNAPAVVDAIRKTMPAAEAYYKNTINQMKSNGYLESYFGRRRHFGLITPDSRHHMENEGINFRIQSPGSDVMLMCMLYLWDNKQKWDIWPFWPVHDSITMDIPDPKIMPMLKTEMEKYATELVHGAVPFVWESNWGYDWAMSKTLEEHFHEDTSKIKATGFIGY